MFGIKLAFESVHMYCICLHMQMCVSGLTDIYTCCTSFVFILSFSLFL